MRSIYLNKDWQSVSSQLRCANGTLTIEDILVGSVGDFGLDRILQEITSLEERIYFYNL